MTMTRCPLCRAQLAGPDTCPRCGADLTSARAASSQAEGHLKQALVRLAAGDRQRAAVYTDRALRLHHTALAGVLADWLLHLSEPRQSYRVCGKLLQQAVREQNQPLHIERPFRDRSTDPD